jgi:hypothetical protein
VSERSLPDEMLSGAIAEQLRARRFDVIALVEAMAFVASRMMACS